MQDEPDCTHTDTVERDLREDIYDDFCKYYQFRKRLIENPKSLYTRKETISKFCKTLDDIPRTGMSKQEKNLLLDPLHVEEVLNGPLADLAKTNNKFTRMQIMEKRKYLSKVMKAKEGYALIQAKKDARNKSKEVAIKLSKTPYRSKE